MRKLLTAAIMGLLAQGAAAQIPVEQSAANIHAHMTFLASDLLKGREAGSPEYDIAANYVAAQMEQLGLKPMGDHGSYFQAVPLYGFRLAGPGSMTLHGKDTVDMVFGQDFVASGRGMGHVGDFKIDAPLVFAGFGVVAPQHGRDDYKGLDVRGKIVVVMEGAPKAYQSEERAYYGSGATKAMIASAHGAVAILQMSTPSDERRQPFSNGARQYQSWGMTWRNTDGTPFLRSPIPSLGVISVAGAAKMFAGAKQSADTLFAWEVGSQAPMRGFALPQSLRATFTVEGKMVESKNIVGLLPGTDPKLKSQYVVLSAHLDHLGITPPVNGDSINNGALDNASGVATTLEVAHMFSAAKPPRRSLLFLIDTAEEKGLLGADYFARNATVPLSAISSDVDLDMPILTYDFTDVTAFGADRSSIGPAVARAAARMNIKLSPDPLPEEGIFVRSDHYRFVEQGVPAVFLTTGFANGGEAAWRDFLAHHYHKPSDDLSLPIRYDAGAKFARLNYEVTRELADDDARPVWNKGDFFGDLFAGKHRASAP